MAPRRVGARRREGRRHAGHRAEGRRGHGRGGVALATGGHAVAGCIQYSEETDPDYFSAAVDIFVGTAAQGRGVGPDAMRTLITWLLDVRGHHRLTVDPAAENARAIHVYERLGFRPVGVLRRYERVEDGVLARRAPHGTARRRLPPLTTPGGRGALRRRARRPAIAWAGERPPYPKIELHVHLEATIRPERLLELGRRNDVKLPARTVAGPAPLLPLPRASTSSSACGSRRRGCCATDRTSARSSSTTPPSWRPRAASTPSRCSRRPSRWRAARRGRRSSRATATAPTRRVSCTAWSCASRRTSRATSRRRSASELAGWAVRFRDRGVAGISLGGSEHRFPPAPFARAFAIAREGGLKAAPHAGETAGPESIRSALDDLHADRLRHGVRAVEDAALLAELADRGVVCDVTPVSNLRTGVVSSLNEHPLPAMLAAGVQVLHRQRRPGAHADVALRGLRRGRPRSVTRRARCTSTRSRARSATSRRATGSGQRATYSTGARPALRSGLPNRVGPQWADVDSPPDPWRIACAPVASALCCSYCPSRMR